MFRYAVWLGCFLLILPSESILAQSSPPLLTNDPGTPGPGKWEINVLTSLERSNVNEEWEIPLFDFNYGVGDRCQLTTSIPFVVSREQGGEVRRAFDGVEIGVKYRFVDNPGTTGHNISLFPTVFFSFVDDKAMKLFLPFEWHLEWSKFGLTAELGHAWVNGKPDGWEGGVGAGVLLDPVALLAEWHTQMREAPFNLLGQVVDLGFTWEWSETVSAFGSFGKSLENHDEAPTKWILAGVQFQF